MELFIQITIGIAALVFFIWLCIPSGSTGVGESGRLIDPNNSRQIAQLIGMTGGSIPDAAVARYALQRFQEIYGRPATTLDVGALIGIMQTTDDQRK